jgi:hypothetical protein
VQRVPERLEKLEHGATSHATVQQQGGGCDRESFQRRKRARAASSIPDYSDPQTWNQSMIEYVAQLSQWQVSALCDALQFHEVLFHLVWANITICTAESKKPKRSITGIAWH